MPSDYRYDPFSDTSTAVSITNELHVIPTASPFTIRLSEVPDKTAALAMKVRDSLASAIVTADSTSITVANGAWFANGNVITVDSEQMLVDSVSLNTLTVTRGYNSTVATTHTSGTAVLIDNSMTKVSANPTSGQFWPDYSTGADGDENWNTGLIQFNAADAGKTVVANYNGMGSLVSADSHGSQLFTESGTFTAPKGVTKVRITGCGGGGAGYGGTTPTVTAGGATSFGSLLTLSGGGAGTAIANGASGGFGGQAGWTSGYHEYDYVSFIFGHGGDSLFGLGGHGIEPVAATGYGSGGAPKTSLSDYANNHGGGGAQCCLKEEIAVVPGQTYTITIGAAGTNNKNSACNGTAGFLLVEW